MCCTTLLFCYILICLVLIMHLASGILTVVGFGLKFRTRKGVSVVGELFGFVRTDKASSFDEAFAAVSSAKITYASKPSWRNKSRWSRATWAMIKHADSYERARQAFYNAPPDTWVYASSLRHWRRVCVRSSSFDTHFDRFQGILAQAKAIPDGGKAEELVLLKWIDACLTQEQAEIVYRNTNERTKAGRKAIKRWCELTITRAVVADNPEDAQAALDHAPPETDARHFAERLRARFP